MGTLRRKPGREIWTAIYRDGDGIKREISTGCKSKDGAKRVLSDLEAGVERIKSGVVSRQEARTMEWAAVSLLEHITAHEAYLAALHRATSTVTDQKRCMTAISDACGWKRLTDLNRPQLERWLTLRVSEGMGARTRNRHAGAAVAFGNWLVKAGRLTVNPFAGVPHVNEKTDLRRERRVLTMEEFSKLLEAAERRPLAEASENRGSVANLKPGTTDRLRWIGRVRAMVYRVLMFSGLRYGELRSITLGQVRLDAPVPHFELRAADEKARRGAQVPVPAGLAAMLVEYISERRQRLLGLSSASDRASVTAFPGALETVALFDMPGGMVKVFDADLVFAGLAARDDKGKIKKRDAQGRTVDIHALRHSFCTMVAQSGVNMQTAQRLMRHATPAMTARYTHLTLTDLGGAMATLPALPEPQRDIAAVAEIAPNLRPTLRPTLSRTSIHNGALSRTSDSQNKGAIEARGNGRRPNVSGDFRGILHGTGEGTRTLDPWIHKHSHSALLLMEERPKPLAGNT